MRLDFGMWKQLNRAGPLQGMDLKKLGLLELGHLAFGVR